jgi:membrane-associated phospholipid phosphatase
MAMKIVSILGTEIFIIPLILFIFWCVDEKQGACLGILIIISAWLNSFLKYLLKQPRPFNLEPSLGLAFESSYGFPSGHAQTSLTLILFLVIWASSSRRASKTRLIWIGAIFLVLLIAFSRIYLGLHFLTDIAGGWIIGGCILVLFYHAGPWIVFLLNSAGSFAGSSGGKRSRIIAAAAAALVMNGIYPNDPSLPALMLGFGAGYALSGEKTALGENGKKWFILLARYTLGLAGAALIYFILKLVLPGEGSLFSSFSFWGSSSPYLALGRFIQYGLPGLWVAAGAPLLFARLGMREA